MGSQGTPLFSMGFGGACGGCPSPVWGGASGAAFVCAEGGTSMGLGMPPPAPCYWGGALGPLLHSVFGRGLGLLPLELVLHPCIFDTSPLSPVLCGRPQGLDCARCPLVGLLLVTTTTPGAGNILFSGCWLVTLPSYACSGIVGWGVIMLKHVF